ncbi:putative F-box domain-containing protein [Medicago truncatula]|uniref:F-box-like protein n=1 Tax=Medicago truncatula TaxID=3880 RepID=G7IKF9_MEDTR|nr:F-box-like protein [Medicago truncatula]RHN72410.1 putative F-box domain-containing protein [Medicago truncatula]
MVEATMESPSTILPDELIIEILFRVESSNPFQLMCVCKLWNSLILDPQFMKKHVGRSLTEIKDLHNKAKEHYIAFQSQIVGNNPIMPQEQVDGDDHEDEDEEAAAEEEGDEGEEGNEQVDGDDHEDEDDYDKDEDEEAAEEEGDEGEEGNEQVDGDDHEDEDDYDKDEDEDEEAAEEEVDEAEKGNDNEEGKEEDAEEEDKEKKLLMNIVAQLDVVLGNVVGQLNILDTIKVSQLDDMLVKTIRANLLAQLDRVKCLKSFLEVYLESPTSSFSSSQL